MRDEFALVNQEISFQSLPVCHWKPLFSTGERSLTNWVID